MNLLDGVIAGIGPGLLGASLALVYRTAGVLSFGHATMGAGAVYAAWFFRCSGFDGLLVSGLAGALLALPLAFLIPTAHRQRKPAAIVITLGYAIFLEGTWRALFGAETHAFLHVLADFSILHLGPLRMVQADLNLLLIALALGILVQVAIYPHRLGASLRASGRNPQLSESLGLPVLRLQVLGWALSGFFVGVAGWLLVPQLGLETHMLWSSMAVGFVAAAAGGMDEPAKALGLGIGLGVVEQLLGALVGPSALAVLRGPMYAGLLVVGARRD